MSIRLSAPAVPAPRLVGAETGGATVLRAERVAAALLEDVGTRLAHTRRVASQAGAAMDLLTEPWRSALVPAAWLHDVGYNEALAFTGFHPLDGARYLRNGGWPAEVCRLVAWHTGAGEEAALRRLGDLLVDEFDEPPADPAAALAWADLTSSPAGERWSARERVAEILRRYQPGSIVHQAVTASSPELLSSASRIEGRLVAAQPM